MRSEILTRQWHHVDLRAGWLRLEPGETKNTEGRMFPLIPALRALLERQRADIDKLQRATGQIIPWVFHHEGTPIRYFRRSWMTACRKGGVPGRLPHVATQTRTITEAERDQWLSQLRAVQAAGDFLGGRVHIFCWGVKP